MLGKIVVVLQAEERLYDYRWLLDRGVRLKGTQSLFGYPSSFNRPCNHLFVCLYHHVFLLYPDNYYKKYSFQISTQNDGLTPFEKTKGFFGQFRRLKHRQSSFLTLFQQKIITDSFPISTQNRRLTPLENHAQNELFIRSLLVLFAVLTIFKHLLLL